MDRTRMHSEAPKSARCGKWVLAAILLAAAAFLWTEQRAHLLGALPYLLLLACPLMHLLHHGHGHGDASDANDTTTGAHHER